MTKPLGPATPMFSASYPTAFGLYDADQQWCDDCDNFIVYTRRKLGSSVLSVELTARDLATCFEEGTLEYNALVNIYRSRDIALSVMGVQSGSISSLAGRIPDHSMRLLKHYAQPANIDAGMGGKTIYSGSFTANEGVQNFHLEDHFSIAAGKRMEVRDVYWKSPWQFMRLFNTTTALNYLSKELNFSSYTPETMFYLLPIHEDVLRVSMFRLQDQVRRSRYSWHCINNVLTLYPAPRTQKTVWLKYTIEDWQAQSDETRSFLYPSGSIDHPSNIPFGLYRYSSLNQMARQYIRKIGFCTAKLMLSEIRGKFMSIPIPDGEITLNASEMSSQAQAELESIKMELKEHFEQFTTEALMEKERAKQENIQETYKKIAFPKPLVWG